VKAVTVEVLSAKMLEDEGMSSVEKGEMCVSDLLGIIEGMVAVLEKVAYRPLKATDRPATRIETEAYHEVTKYKMYNLDNKNCG